MVNALALPAFLAAAITLYVGIFNFLTYLNIRSEKGILAFSLLAFSTSIYQISCAMLYGSSTLDQALFWQRFNFLGIVLIGILLLNYVYYQFKKERSTTFYLFTGLFSLFIVIPFFDSPYTLSLSNETRELTNFTVTFTELIPGFLLNIELLLSMVVFIHILSILFQYRKTHQNRHDQVLIAAIIIFLMCTLNDSLIAGGVRTGLYLVEYGFLIIVLAMTYGRAVQFIELHKQLADLNNSLEERVVQRTKDIEVAKEEAEQANRAKSRFLANMSHDIRTPMNGIIAVNQFILESELTKEQRSHAEIIDKSSHQLLKLLHDILDYSKIEADQLDVEQHSFSLIELIERVTALLTPQAEDKDIHLTTIVSRDIDWIICDSARLTQIIINLVSNAIKFTNDGTVQVQIVHKDSELKFSIEDTGIGIDQSKLKHVFTPFSQEDDSTTRKFGGTGLGLTITHDLVELLGGTISLESEKGVGTTVTFTIPYVKGTVPISVKETEVNIDSFRGKHVLIAEDNKVNALVATKIMENFNLTVTLVEDGLSALSLAKKEKYDIIFLDIQMPQMDGTEVAQRIRTGKTPNQQTPLVAMTANAMLGDKQKYHRSGMEGYVSKPISKESILKTLVKYL